MPLRSRVAEEFCCERQNVDRPIFFWPGPADIFSPFLRPAIQNAFEPLRRNSLQTPGRAQEGAGNGRVRIGIASAAYSIDNSLFQVWRIE